MPKKREKHEETDLNHNSKILIERNIDPESITMKYSGKKVL